MSLQLKVFLIISAIVAAISASGVIIGISSVQNQILKTLEVDMGLVASLSNEFISGEIDLLKTNAAAVAERLKNTQSEELADVLIEQVAAYEQFKAIAIFNSAGKIETSYGIATATEEIIRRYGREAYEGQRVIPTSYLDSSGQLVFHVLVPFDEHQYIIGEADLQPKIVACTVPGLFLSEQLSRFLIWDTGNIAIVDRYGTIIANVQNEWVLQRLNFLELAQQDRHYKNVSRAMRHMADGVTGTDHFYLGRTDVVIAYTPVTASEQGWSLAVIAPIKESPVYKAQIMILIAGIVFLGMGLIAAAIGSGFIAKRIK